MFVESFLHECANACDFASFGFTDFGFLFWFWAHDLIANWLVYGIIENWSLWSPFVRYFLEFITHHVNTKTAMISNKQILMEKFLLKTNPLRELCDAKGPSFISVWILWWASWFFPNPKYTENKIKFYEVTKVDHGNNRVVWKHRKLLDLVQNC
jgi:hypothetical protein